MAQTLRIASVPAEAIPSFDGVVNFGKALGPDGEMWFTATFLAAGRVWTFASTFENARTVYECWGQALESEHVDVVRNGGGKLWSPGET